MSTSHLTALAVMVSLFLCLQTAMKVYTMSARSCTPDATRDPAESIQQGSFGKAQTSDAAFHCTQLMTVPVTMPS